MALLRYLVTLTLILFVLLVGNIQGQAHDSASGVPAPTSTAVYTSR